MFTYAHVKWFYGQSERAYYLNYFIINLLKLEHIEEYFCKGVTKKRGGGVISLCTRRRQVLVKVTFCPMSTEWCMLCEFFELVLSCHLITRFVCCSLKIKNNNKRKRSTRNGERVRFNGAPGPPPLPL